MYFNFPSLHQDAVRDVPHFRPVSAHVTRALSEMAEPYAETVCDPRKRTYRRVSKKPYEDERERRAEEEWIVPPCVKRATALFGMQKTTRAAEMELLRRTLGEGQVEFVPAFGWVCRNTPEPDNASARASDDDIRRERMGAWLGELARWTHFCTWTFSRPVNVAAAMHFGRVHLRWLARWDVDTERGGTIGDFLKQNRYRDQRDVLKDERTRQKAARRRVRAFLATERGETGGLIHLHALAANITNLRPFCGVQLPDGEWGVNCCMVHAWPCGYARVFPYDPALGAKYYVSKYVIKGYLAEWEFVGDFPCPGRACSLALR
jgi:hypothetical protein